MFGSDSTSWVFKWHNIDFSYNEIAYVSKDTVIGGLSYKKVSYYNHGASFSPSAPCILREDTLTGKVWFRSLDPTDYDTTDVLAFDFSLMPGDSFDISNMENHFVEPLYAKVDSVRYLSGLKYIYFNMNYLSWDTTTAVVVASEPYMIIEGIGSNMGPLWKQMMGGYRDHYLLCSSKNGVKTSYNNIRYAGSCVLPSLAINEKQVGDLKVRLAPNPVGDYTGIVSEGREFVAGISLYDGVGKLFLEPKK